jgi:hypothetical protein
MLRTPKVRGPAIKYLDKRVPKSPKDAVELAKARKIFTCDFVISLKNSDVHIDVKNDMTEER